MECDKNIPYTGIMSQFVILLTKISAHFVILITRCDQLDFEDIFFTSINLNMY
jgi:hypothetical protein